jgi:ferredoxin-NADP reductase
MEDRHGMLSALLAAVPGSRRRKSAFPLPAHTVFYIASACRKGWRFVPQWSEASIWFCGPAQFGQSLRKDFTANRLAPEHFHQELFEMR